MARFSSSEDDKTHDDAEPVRLRRGGLQAVAVAFSTFCLLLFTSSRLPVVWDEGFMDYRADGLVTWSLHLCNQIPVLRTIVPRTPEYEAARENESISLLLSDWGIDSYLQAAEGHPYLPVLLAAGKKITPPFLSGKVRLRFGAILYFSIAVGAVFYRLRSDFGPSVAWFGVLSILLLPRVFTHVQIATWESPLVASWLLCWAFFPLALKSTEGTALFGIAVGLACSSKFPGFAVVLPVFAWIVLRLALDRTFFAGKRIVLLRRALITTLAAFLVFFFLNPSLWFDLLYGLGKFFRLNMNRDINISILYFGRMYDLYHSLPWTNTLVWTAITVPAGLLALFFVGLVATVRDREKRWAGLFLFLNFLALIIIRACPGTPVHDGVRLFVAAFPFLGIIAGLGAATLWNVSGRKRIASRILVGAIYFVGVFNMFWYAPQWLSYYNLLIGGLPGATRAGMEPTYYWDGFDPELIEWLDAHTRPGETVAFGDWYGVDSAFGIYRAGAATSPRFQATPRRRPLDIRKTSGDIRYYVLQRRPSSEFEQDKYLIENVEPVFVKTIRKGGWGPWNLASVPIVEIYDLEKLETERPGTGE